MRKPDKKQTCVHKFEFSHVESELPEGEMDGVAPQHWTVLICPRCGEMKRRHRSGWKNAG